MKRDRFLVTVRYYRGKWITGTYPASGYWHVHAHQADNLGLRCDEYGDFPETES